MKSLAILLDLPSLFVTKDEIKPLTLESEKKVISFYKGSTRYANLPLEEKWKYRKKVNDLQVLINKIQNEEVTSIDSSGLNLPEVVNLLRIRKEMLTSK